MAKLAGQTLNDRLLAARHSIAGQGLAKSVCKATTEEMIGPKKKHLDYLLHCTNEPNVSIPQMANLLIERSQHSNWVVVYKALITVHHMMCYGNERFTQYLASSNCNFQLGNFLDKSGVQGSRVGYDMSPYIRRYAKYLNEKALSYRTVAFDFCKVKRGKEAGTLRTMGPDQLLKTLPVLQNHLDALLEFDCSANDLTNGVINMAFMLLFRDLIRLFACYNDGIINLLEKYFDMNKKQCRDALDLYKKFLIRMDRVAEFLKVAEAVGIDKGDIPDLTKAPSSLLDALEQHLASLEGRKPPTTSTNTQNKANITSGVSALSSTSAAFGSAASSSRVDSQQNGTSNIDENLKRQALAEEEAVLNQYKEKHTKGQTPTGGPSTNPFLSSPATNNSQPILDLFGQPAGGGSQPGQPGKASDDLLQLSGNPFADIFTASGAAPPMTSAMPANNNFWGTTNGVNGSAQTTTSNAFVSETNFSAVFGETSTGFDAFGDILQPMPTANTPATLGGGNVPPTNNVSTSQAPPSKVLTGDLDSSLASLAQNLTINKGGQPPNKGIQWNSPKNTAKTGGINFTAQPMATTANMPFRPMGQGMGMGMGMPGQFPQMQPMGFQGMRPPGAGPVPGTVPPMMGGGGVGPNPMMNVMGGVPQQPPFQPPITADNSLKLDPFGAL